MKVSYRNHTPPEPGYGILAVSEWGEARPDRTGVEFMLKRASDQKNLSRGGWREEERFLQPLQVEEQGKDLLLYVGPQVVDNLDLREVYRFYLNWPGLDQPLRAALRVSELFYSPLDEIGGMDTSSPAALPETPRVREARPAPSASSPSSRLENMTIIPDRLKGETREPFSSEPLTPQPEPPSAGRPPSSGLRRRPYFLIAAAILALILIVGHGVYDFLSEEEPPPIPPLQQAYQHLAQANPDPQASLELALRLRGLGSDEAQDSAFLLLEDAANKNNPQAMLLLGGYYDPLDTAPNGSIIKDSEQALVWYSRAAAGGQEAAKAKVETLRQWTEENHEEN